MHAVEPALVRQLPNRDVTEVLAQLDALAPAPMLVISGGNPALWHLGPLLGLLRCDSIVVSPKPPSSGMATEAHAAQLAEFMRRSAAHRALTLKIVVFDQADLEYALAVHEQHPERQFFLSCGTSPDDTPEALGQRYRWLCEEVAHEPRAHAARVLPQLHVIAWGHMVGV
jgi:7-carboxy-7-deazaguanine synthase